MNTSLSPRASAKVVVAWGLMAILAMVIAVAGFSTRAARAYYGANAYNYWFDGRFGDFWTSTINYINTH